MQTESMRLPVTATQVGAADASAQTIKTLATAAEIARVPVACTFHKAAGTAYSAATGDLQIVDEDGAIWFTMPAAGFLDSALEKARVVIASTAGQAFTANNTAIKLSANGTITAAAASPGITVTIHMYVIPLK